MDGALLLGFAFRYEGRKAPYVARGLLSIAAGKVLVIVEAPSLEPRDRADAVMHANGGRVAHKPLF